ncbi:hypothetical protein KKA14_20945 [bacterium]|nr:hypothetical protein [bacterium]
MERFQIKGVVTHQKLGTGFWGIVDENKKKWRPINFPDDLKQEGLQVELAVEKAQESVSIFMWGKPVKIVS